MKLSSHLTDRFPADKAWLSWVPELCRSAAMIHGLKTSRAPFPVTGIWARCFKLLSLLSTFHQVRGISRRCACHREEYVQEVHARGHVVRLLHCLQIFGEYILAGKRIPDTEIICILDADQAVHSDFFLRTVHLLDGGEDVGMVSYLSRSLTCRNEHEGLSQNMSRICDFAHASLLHESGVLQQIRFGSSAICPVL